MPEYLIEVSDEQLALFRKAMNPATDSGFGLADVQPYQLAQAEIVGRIVVAADQRADADHAATIARECLNASPQHDGIGLPRLIYAIKMYRDRTGATLREAKARIEAADADDCAMTLDATDMLKVKQVFEDRNRLRSCIEEVADWLERTDRGNTAHHRHMLRTLAETGDGN